MKIKTSELLGPVLNWAVARADDYDEGWLARQLKNPNPYTRCIPEFSTDWNEGGPIIERKDISVTRQVHSEVTESGKEIYRKDGWTAYTTAASYWITPTRCNGPTPLIAAMRCLVASKLGDEVEIPDGL